MYIYFYIYIYIFLFDRVVVQILTSDKIATAAFAPRRRPCHYGPSAGALDAESPNSKNVKEPKTFVGREIDVFLTDLHHILHARSCTVFFFKICPAKIIN